jgi:RNA polymerase sigma-70 factor, ECF subfamily
MSDWAPDASSDRRLLNAARAGDATAFWRLAEPRRAYLKAVVRRILGERLPSDGSDVVAHTMDRARERIAQFQGTSAQQFLGWLAAIARNEALQALRRADRVGPLPDDAEVDLAADGSGPDERASRRERGSRLLMAIDRLPEDSRRVIQLRNLQELPYAEVARQMDRSEEAVRQLWSRALRRLKDELGALS